MLLMNGLEKGVDWMRATGGDGGLDSEVERTNGRMDRLLFFE